MKRHVVIIGTIYSLLLYLLYKASQKEEISTVYFLSDKLAAFVPRLRDAVIIREFKPYKNLVLRKVAEIFWVISLRIKRATIWRKYFKGAVLFAQDHFVFSSMLIGSRDYIYISDGFNDFYAYMRTDMFHNTLRWRNDLTLKNKFIKFVCGPTWMGWFCLNEQCAGVLHENPQKIPYAKREQALIKVDMRNIWHNICSEKKTEICRCFELTETEIKQISQYPILVLAQNFECTDNISENELVAIYRNAIAAYDESRVIIKTHPFGKIHYQDHFPRAFVLDKHIPMQLLVLAGARNIRTVITINSTAISLFGDNVEICWLGETVHPVLLAHYGKNTMEEIVYRNQYNAAK